MASLDKQRSFKSGCDAGTKYLPASEIVAARVRSKSSVFFTDSDLEQAEMMKERDEGSTAVFDLMHIQIVIYGVTGIICEKQEGKRKPPGRTGSGLSSFLFGGGHISPADSCSISVPSMVMTDESNMTEEDSIVKHNDESPMTAVASFRKNALRSDMSIESFLPSLPLARPAKTDCSCTRFKASWPVEKSVLVQSPIDIDQSSFNFTRCMKQQTFVPDDIPKDGGAVANYAHETAKLQISLSKGTELIRLGEVSVAISGDEEGEFQMLVPIKPIIRKKKRSFKPKTDTKWNKYGYFSDELDKRYFLDDNATARVGIKVIPHNTIQAEEEREMERIHRTFFEQHHSLRVAVDGDDGMENDIQVPMLGAHRNLPREDPPAAPIISKPPSNGILSGLFCGALMCAPENDLEVPVPQKRNTVPEAIVATKDIRRQFAAASLISSVSESSDESSVTETEFRRIPSKQAPPPSRLAFGARGGAF